MGWVALAACASGPKPTPDPEVQAQLKALAERQARLEQKIEALETRLAFERQPSRTPSSQPAPAAARPMIPSHLTTVKLRPEQGPAPRVPTDVALREPDPDRVAEILAEAGIEDEEEPSAGAADEELKAARTAITNGDVERGAADLIAWAVRNPQRAEAPEALYLAGHGLQNWGDLDGAVAALDRVVEQYPASKQAPDALMRLSECYLRQKKVEDARASLSKVVEQYSGTQAARSAQAQLKGLPVESKKNVK